MRKNQALTGLAAAAVFTMGFVPVSQAYAAEPCVPNAGHPAESGAWSWTAFTPWQADPAQPADPDGESGGDNIANVTQIGEGYADTADGAYRQKVSDGWQRFTPWQTDPTPPGVAANEEAGHRYERTVEGEGWTETKTVVVKKAWTETIEGAPGVWANFSPNDSQATFVGPPTYPSDQRGTWHHHGDLPPGQAGSDGVYANGNPAKGGNWFYREAGTEAQTIEHPAVTEEVTVEHPRRHAHRVPVGRVRVPVRVPLVGLRAHQRRGHRRGDLRDRAHGPDGLHRRHRAGRADDGGADAAEHRRAAHGRTDGRQADAASRCPVRAGRRPGLGPEALEGADRDRRGALR